MTPSKLGCSNLQHHVPLLFVPVVKKYGPPSQTFGLVGIGCRCNLVIYFWFGPCFGSLIRVLRGRKDGPIISDTDWCKVRQKPILILKGSDNALGRLFINGHSDISACTVMNPTTENWLTRTVRWLLD